MAIVEKVVYSLNESCALFTGRVIKQPNTSVEHVSPNSYGEIGKLKLSFLLLCKFNALAPADVMPT